MRYLTDRKRAEGRGAAHSGTADHWYMTVSAVALAFMTPAFIYVMGSAIGTSHEEVLATFSRPFPAILAGLYLVVAMQHFRRGAAMMISDYSQGITRKALTIGAISISYAVIAAGVFALARIAL
ncbi:succinate dehydrogenase, hydrophobic membrane anchor protein [Phaeovulum vinaykumarii]|uniref:Succinate dehydrogenase hydrophobic membrane anchor subunit n=1 Tax=Phaeovulum vinaykumarii TaxID=407234 RepID=A0A1N7KTC8_9RHOB|nr:succinate dehydrogenase, hydrophobic membrane anchor protein [Phaeovulum vinaykumarii]SIS64849.1 succinate dehydrogenase subunit D [Phaeovulum vinaykumarii]SOC01473.1 succinate dehydrogenase subunit D [Phaeovulum vinaykumarii]